MTDHAPRTDTPYVEVSAGPMRARILTESGPRIIGLEVDGLGELMGSTDVAVNGPLGAVPLIGGHRLWAAPETPENTYLPDTRVRMSSIEGGVRVESDDSRLVLAKAIEVTADDDRLVIDHTLVNRSSESREAAVWGLTMVRLGGRILIPAPEVGLDERGLQARFAVVTWPYTNVHDERFTFDADGVAVTADGDVPFKIGVTSLQGLVSYEVGGVSFHKRIDPFDPDRVHVDLGAVIQVYVGGGFCEIETLGPLRRLAPGDLITHREVWEIG